MLNLYPETIAKAIEGDRLLAWGILDKEGSVIEHDHPLLHSYFALNRYSYARTKRFKVSRIQWSYFWRNTLGIFENYPQAFINAYVFQRDLFLLKATCPPRANLASDNGVVTDYFYVTKLSEVYMGLPKFYSKVYYVPPHMRGKEANEEALCTVKLNAQGEVQTRYVKFIP